MATIDVEVDIEEFDDRDVLEYAEEIIKKAEIGKRKSAEKWVREFRLNIREPNLSENTSKVDVWKDELWPKIKAKYTLEQLEALL